MATEKTDVVIVGVGAAGGILAAELGKAGMKVIGLERGPRLATKDFSPQDELRYFQRQDLRPDPKRQPIKRQVVDPGDQAAGCRCDRQLQAHHQRHVLPGEQRQQRTCDRRVVLRSRWLRR